ncbi:MalY/PatB family protein [Feifania hominis]|uniref:cysteine-S-conjugate beta-lyase n=1 Tax=Feifania hominis TaxID=2763660 RepID=A0A926HTC5_9FIRM|nr:MalY/PatB family protein [Feifania hominis]MBC8535729.1 pyridoxal phosphate-dependent aminotransferase [Feifania hominis]
MRTYDFDQVVDRIGTNSVKWEFFRKNFPDAPEDTVALWVADMDFPCAQEIVEAIHKRADRLIFGYSDQGTDEFYDDVTAWYRRRFGWQIDRESIFFSPGVVPAIAVLIRALTEPGDGILIQRPVYYPFTQKIEANGRRVVNSPLIYRNGTYQMDFDDLERKLADPGTKGMVLCSPHNPVGRVWSTGELKQLVGICERHHKWIISDEIHGDLVRDGVNHHPLEMVCPGYRNEIITCTAPSKTFNIAGLHFSNIIINNPVYREAWNLEANSKISLGRPNPLSIAAVSAAYRHGESWLEQVNAYISANIEYVSDYVRENLPLATVVPTEGTYLMWIDFRAYCADAKLLEERMLKVGHVALDEGYIFGEEGAGFERINVACPRSILEKCMEGINRAIRSL